MIRSVTANQPTFKTVQFGPGLNVVWADRTKDSTKKDSRNGLGKSTLIEIIHFCLGSTPKKGKGLMVEALADWEFTLELDVSGKTVRATRATGKPRRITVEGDATGLPRSGRASGGECFVDVNDWTDWLGQRLFGLSSAEQPPKYQPQGVSI